MCKLMSKYWNFTLASMGMAFSCVVPKGLFQILASSFRIYRTYLLSPHSVYGNKI